MSGHGNQDSDYFYNRPRRPLGCALAMRVLQSDIYPTLDDAERADCDELVRRNLDWCKGVGTVGVETCPTCRGSRVVDDGEITHSSGAEFLNGPIKCVADCPTCKGVGTVGVLGTPETKENGHG
jgi:hypothetical protein